jgi:hypothetical protein
MLLRAIIALAFIALASSCAVSAQPTTVALPQDPATLLSVAYGKNGLTGPDVKPWHMHGTYHHFDSKGKAEYEGTYEEWWVSPTKYKLRFTSPNFSRTDYANGSSLLRDGTQELPPGPELLLRTSVIEPLIDPSLLRNSHCSSAPLKPAKFSFRACSLLTLCAPTWT